MHIKENAFISSDEAKDAIGNSIIDHSIYSVFGNNTTELLNHSEVFNTLELYKALIADMLDHLGDGENVLSNSMLVNKALCSFFNPSENYKRDAINKYSAINAMEILLPNIRDASLEDLLYIRHYANDELIEMRNYIDTCVSNLQLDGLSVIDVKMINENLRKKIIPATHQFERRIETLKLSSVQQFIKNIANPLYYSPLITSFFADIHPALLLAMSLGLIGIESITNYKIKNNEIKNDSLYFTVEINKYQS
jgi:hypothetical protein